MRWVGVECPASVNNIFAFVFDGGCCAIGIDLGDNVEKDEVLLALRNTGHRAVDCGCTEEKTFALVLQTERAMHLLFVAEQSITNAFRLLVGRIVFQSFVG